MPKPSPAQYRPPVAILNKHGLDVVSEVKPRLHQWSPRDSNTPSWSVEAIHRNSKRKIIVEGMDRVSECLRFGIELRDPDFPQERDDGSWYVRVWSLPPPEKELKGARDNVPARRAHYRGATRKGIFGG